MAEIIVCAENAVTRAGLAAMAATAATTVVAKVDSLFALNAWLQIQSADLIVMELSDLGKGSHEDILNELIEIVESLPPEESLPILLMLSSAEVLNYGEKSHRLGAQMLDTGLVSILPMTVATHQVRDAIAAIINGLIVIHPDITEALFSSAPQALVQTGSFASVLLEPLTARESEVLNQMASGLTNKAIAQALNISEHTVKFHISAILSKLNVTSRTEAVAVGIRSGLVML
ncbi:MAG: response regulator transcription factor [Phormidesmis sp.]